MTDDTAPDPQKFLDDYMEKERAFKILSTSLHSANKTALFDALEAAGITIVRVHFDGFGDSGQVEDIDPMAGDKPCEFPASTIAIGRARWGVSDVERIECNVRDAVEALAYAFLQETHSGWEINEGAYGDFTFNVADRSIALDYNQRIETSEYSQHIF